MMKKLKALFQGRKNDAVMGYRIAEPRPTLLAACWAMIYLGLPVLLLGLTIVSVGAIGYQWGLRGRWHPVVGALLLLAWSGCLTMIVDLANPRLGPTRVDVAPYEWTREGFAGGVPIPPAPR
jgi:hypothetical protein